MARIDVVPEKRGLISNTYTSPRCSRHWILIDPLAPNSDAMVSHTLVTSGNLPISPCETPVLTTRYLPNSSSPVRLGTRILQLSEDPRFRLSAIELIRLPSISNSTPTVNSLSGVPLYSCTIISGHT